MITFAFFALTLVSCLIYRAMKPRGRGDHHSYEKIQTPGFFRYFYLYLVVSTILAVMVFPNWSHVWFLQWHHSYWIGISGFAIACSGMALFVWSMVHLAGQYSPCYDARMPSQIVGTGPYKSIRHPVYTANLILLVGVAVATGSLWMVINFIGLLGFYLHCAPIEEKALSKSFPDYRHYLNVSGRFLPRLRSVR